MPSMRTETLHYICPHAHGGAWLFESLSRCVKCDVTGGSAAAAYSFELVWKLGRGLEFVARVNV